MVPQALRSLQTPTTPDIASCPMSHLPDVFLSLLICPCAQDLPWISEDSGLRIHSLRLMFYISGKGLQD